jgi:hypothetical protein
VERDHANLGEEDESLTRWLGYVDVPSSIRAHWLGQKKAARALCEARLVEYLAEAGLDEEGETAAALVRGVVGAVAGKRAPEKPDGPTHRGSEAN